MNILDTIIADKYKEVAERKSLYPVKLLEQSIHFDVTPVSLKKYIQREDKSGIIAEIKRKSPSMGVINKHVSVERISIGYMQAGASALSVLTDKPYFGGDNEDLLLAREYNYCPILRKDFVVDEYQLIEAKAIGADAILLIASVLPPERIAVLAAFAQSLGLQVMLEVHNSDELQNNLHDSVDLIGVNNRNLKTFEVTTDTSKELAELIPDQYVMISESGLSDPKTVQELKSYGYQGFLIGEAFMQHARPDQACANFIEELNMLKNNTVVI